MASIFSSTVQSTILSLLLSRLPLHPLDLPQQSSFTFKGNSGPSLHLTDITLDIDKLQSQYLPPSTPVNIRHAHVKDLKISISTSGIQIFVKGVTCVISPKASIENGQFLDPSNSIILKGLDDPLEGLEGMVESVVGFVDAVSGANSFTNTNSSSFNQNKDNINNWEDEIDDDDWTPNDKEFDEQAKKLKEILKKDLELTKDLQKSLENDDPKTSNTLLSYAIDYIMGKVFVSLEDLDIKVIADPIVLNIAISKIKANGSKTERQCSIEGVSVSVIKPELDKENKSDDDYYEDNRTDVDLQSNLNEEEQRSVNNEGNNKSNYDDEDDDYDENLMASSFMAENKNDIQQSLLESAMYSTYDKSIYMSATQGDFYDAETVINEETIGNKEIDNGTILLTIDFIKIALIMRKDLRIEIDNIKVSLTPVPTLVISFMDFLIEVSKQRKISKPILKKGNQKTNSHTNTSIVLQKFLIKDLKISITSKLSKIGLYENNNSDIFHFSLFVLEQKSPNLIQGTLEMFELLSKEEKCVHFASSNSHPDIGFEIQIENDSNIISIITEKPLFFNINYSLIVSLLDFYISLDPAIRKFHELKAVNLKKYIISHESLSSSISPIQKYNNNNDNNNNNSSVTKTSEFVMKLNDIKGVVALSENIHEYIDFSVTPILYDTMKKIAKLNLIEVMITTSRGEAELKFENLEYNDHRGKLAKFKVFDVITQKDILYNARKTFLINEIDFTSSFDVLDNIYKIFDDWISKLKAKIPKETKVRFQNSPVNHQRLNSNFMSKSKIAGYFGLIRKFSYSIDNLNDEFGGVKGELQNIGITSLSENTHQVSVYEIQINRVKNAHNEAIISKGNKWNSVPMLSIKIEKSYHFFLNNLLVNYSGKWLAMFEKDIGKDKYESPVSTNVNINFVNSNPKSRKIVNNEFFVSLTDISIGLEPVNLQSKSILLINKGNAEVVMYNDKTIICQFTSSLISLLLIDDVRNINDKHKNNITNTSMHSVWRKRGYVSIGSLNTIVIKVKINSIGNLENNSILDNTITKSLIDAQLDIEKVNLNLCCDSTQCFIQLLKDLKKPVYFSYDDKYKETTNEINVFDNIEFDFFENLKKEHISKSHKSQNKFSEHLSNNDSKEDLTIVENFYDNVKTYSNISSSSDTSYSNINHNSASISLNSSHFEHEDNNLSAINIIPLTFHVSISEVNIELHDGYDWKETRVQIRRALKRVSKKAQQIDEHLAEDNETKVNGNNTNEMLQTQTLVEETLYHSIMLGVGPKDDPTEIMNQISKNINGYDKNLNKVRDDTQTIDLGKSKAKPLQLKRSIRNKVFIKLDDIDVNFKLLSGNEPHLKEKPDYFSIDENIDDSEIVNQIEISINNLLIKDNVPTSSWNMFAGYMREAGEREIGKNMIKINVDLVRPVARLAAIEMILQINILPLRLYIDQDTLDFLTRFGEFKDQRFIPPNLEIEEMFIEKITINKIVLKLDYKPKKIDYAGIRSGHTNEFMNIFILDESDITLNKVTLYGVPGFSKLNALLNGFWSPDVKKNQLGGVLSGLAPVRSIVNIGSGVNNLVTVPMREYRKDGRIVRSLQVGAIEFTKVTSGEILKFGAKLAAGTQTILENTEEVLGGSGSSARIVRDSSIMRKEIIKSREKKNSRSRRRSSAASFGDEEESDYRRYYFFDKKNTNNDQSDHRSKIINEIAIEDEEDNSDNGSDIDIDIDIDNEAGHVNDGDKGIDESGNISDSDFDSSSDIGFDSRIGITKNKDKDKLCEFEDDTYVVSLYSDQPESFNEGLKTAYNSIQKNFNTAKDALYEASIRASESKTASAALVEFAKATPIVFFRPAIAATEAISKSLLGGVNNINPDEKVKAEEKYKTAKRQGDNNEATEQNKEI